MMKPIKISDIYYQIAEIQPALHGLFITTFQLVAVHIFVTMELTQVSYCCVEKFQSHEE